MELVLLRYHSDSVLILVSKVDFQNIWIKT